MKEIRLYVATVFGRREDHKEPSVSCGPPTSKGSTTGSPRSVPGERSRDGKHNARTHFLKTFGTVKRPGLRLWHPVSGKSFQNALVGSCGPKMSFTAWEACRLSNSVPTSTRPPVGVLEGGL